MHKLTLKLFTLVFYGLCINCATMFSGSSQLISIDSSPTGADVYINNQYYGKTPTNAILDKKNGYEILFLKYGYYNSRMYIYQNIDEFWLILDIVGGILPLCVDAVTGNWNKLSPTIINANLERIW